MRHINRLKSILGVILTPTFNLSLIVCWIFKLFAFSQRQIYLTLDRAQQYFEKVKMKILVLAVAYEGLAVPLFLAVS